MSVVKELKKTSLSVVYEYISDLGKTLTRHQVLGFMAPEASVDDKYDIGVAVGKILVANPKSIENTEVYELLEV